MNFEKLVFISVEPMDKDFRASIALDGLASFTADAESLLKKATRIYKENLIRMVALTVKMDKLRTVRKPIPARLVWKLGDHIFRLVEELRQLGLQLDNIYAHLMRDLVVKKKWLEKVVIFRRYVSSEARIPEFHNWGQYEKGTRRKSELLMKQGK